MIKRFAQIFFSRFDSSPFFNSFGLRFRFRVEGVGFRALDLGAESRRMSQTFFKKKIITPK